MKFRSTEIDKKDDETFRHPHGREFHGVYDFKYNQNVPFFFTREGSEIDLIGQYRGGSIFLICNGPSFANLDKNLLRKPGVITFGMNNGPKSFRPDFWTIVDDPTRFIKSIWLDPKITKFVPQAHFEKPIFDNATWNMTNFLVGECPNVIGYRRNENFNAEHFLDENMMNWGCAAKFGGGRSVMLPALKTCYLLGFRNVFLLGCDMKMSETYTYHFDEQRDQGAVKGNMNTYDRLKHEYLPVLKPIFEKNGFNVYNCNLDSELKVFDFVKFEDAVDFATKELGDVENERTWGMYSKAKEKANWKNEPPPELKTHLNPHYDNFDPQMQTMQTMQPMRPMQQMKPFVPAPKMPQPTERVIRNVPCQGISMRTSRIVKNISLPDE